MSTIYFDIDTQLDFLSPAGALYVKGAEAKLPLIQRLSQHAAAQGHWLLSSMDAHAEDDPEFQHWPHHCVSGTLGQRKPADLLWAKTSIVPSVRRTLLPLPGAQLLLLKQTTSVFQNANLDSLLDLCGADRCVVYGVVTEVCVREAVLGLRQNSREVLVVQDAIAGLQEVDSRAALTEMEAAGAKLIVSGELLG